MATSMLASLLGFKGKDDAASSDDPAAEDIIARIPELTSLGYCPVAASDGTPSATLWTSLASMLINGSQAERDFVKSAIGAPLIDDNERVREEIHSLVQILFQLRCQRRKVTENRDPPMNPAPAHVALASEPCVPRPPLEAASPVRPLRPVRLVGGGLVGAEQQLLRTRLLRLFREDDFATTGKLASERERQVAQYVATGRPPSSASSSRSSRPPSAIAAAGSGAALLRGSRSPSLTTPNLPLASPQGPATVKVAAAPSSCASAATKDGGEMTPPRDGVRSSRPSSASHADPAQALSRLAPCLGFDRIREVLKPLQALFREEYQCLVADAETVQRWIALEMSTPATTATTHEMKAARAPLGGSAEGDARPQPAATATRIPEATAVEEEFVPPTLAEIKALSHSVDELEQQERHIHRLQSLPGLGRKTALPPM